MPLTTKQAAFSLAYVETGNASEAYRRAYNAENMLPESVWRKASELMDNVKVAARIADLRQTMEERTLISVERIEQTFADIAFVDIGELVNWDEEGHVSLTPSSELTRRQRNAVKKVTHVRRTIPQKNAEPIVEETVALELESRKAALDSLAKILGMYKERIDINLVHSLAESMGLSAEEVMREAEAIVKGKITS